ncbi:beta-lactamase family protein [Candidatus Poribacteria bacterium]|nr:beta-lactamase family protein [Candidatus Poribacteria bacterium]MYG05384.1 beta-lactamase family protein [Candidatus Poribacteria bacterium]MYK20240.1 beta-lactamase family protein [Candidatus Poribacteria bacterium]
MTLYEGLPRAVPEDVGMSTSRFGRIAPVMQGYVDDGKIPGALTMIAREGRLVHFEKFGTQDVASAKPIEFDTIFRIYSMTKPITSIAVMMLYEEGRFQLGTPVSEFIPAFKDMQVYTENGQEIVDAETTMTIKHLLTHTSGLIYGGDGEHPINQRYRDANYYRGDLAYMAQELGKIPLYCHPGSAWNYGMSTDVLGYLVEVVSGMSFAEFLETRIFNPLGMNDTAFSVPDEKADRYMTLYEPAEDGGIQVIENAPVSSGPLSFFHSGGAGLQSTAADYLRFCQMLLNDGELDGERLLGRKTVELIRVNHISDEWQPLERTGCGFGLGFAVVTDVADTHSLGSLGTYSWGGLASTTFWIDPVEALIGILMTQLIGDSPFHAQFRVLTYQAIVD